MPSMDFPFDLGCWCCMPPRPVYAIMHCFPLAALLVQAVLLVGFFQEEVDQFRSMMLEMEADMVKVRLRKPFFSN